MTTEFCPRCGAARAGELRFCRSCGFDSAAEVPEAAPIVGSGPAVAPEPTPRPAARPVGTPTLTRLFTGPNRARNTVIAGVAVLVLFIAIASQQSGGNSPSPGSDAGSTASDLPVPVPTTLIDVSGNGINSTQEFTTAGDWSISYSFDCSGFGRAGNFQIYIYSGSDLVGVAANELADSGQDTSYETGAGTYHLEMNSECSWHVTVTG